MVIVTYCFFAVVYLGLAGIAPYPGSYLIKAAPAVSMAWLLFSSRQPVLKAMAIGYIFSAIGDIFLDIDRVRFFVFGLASFLLAHICYSVTLFKFYRREHVSVMKIGFVGLFCLSMLVMIFPNLGKLMVPVIFYVLVIGTMGIAASLAAPGFSLPFVGALVFILSDAILAVDKFLLPVPMARALVMVTYYMGNFLLGYATLSRLHR